MYIDWSNAPEGTTHIYVGSAPNPDDYIHGIPDNSPWWEKVECDVLYEWRADSWVRVKHIRLVNHSLRVKRVEKDLPSAPNKSSVELTDQIAMLQQRVTLLEKYLLSVT
jgi:hypothetical protein